ncbi:MAG: hypothetical protein MK212_14065 [Saprospiraceae bacterium]|nr:hypothetical protein [Saprospiraceae bacterium]
MNRVLFTLILILGSIAFSQAQLKQVNNPNLVQKRLNYEMAKNQPSQSTDRPVDPMAMARKYEETAIRKWKANNPGIYYIPSDDYENIAQSKKDELKGRVVLLSDDKLRWSDIEQYEQKYAPK